MNWDELEDEEFLEICKFDDASVEESSLYSEKVMVVFIQPIWNTLETFVNQWNKNRYRIQCYKIRTCKLTPFSTDEVDEDICLYLDMGKRLLKVMKNLSKKKPKFIKITKIGEKYDTRYFGVVYKLDKKKQSPL